MVIASSPTRSVCGATLRAPNGGSAPSSSATQKSTLSSALARCASSRDHCR
ncbi:Uncharacterised protein [Mycobacterium tuberculosis]|uniref:Uncharacterized protein n=1 Tax=Mycobacterium tuberculosis TaxID=1773 RepID=A0A655JNH9_MYCTX|nr:Uncharacterised protein [Mycobacterium tuberculosis]COX25125.1 Uncharacterised protein [Mycobacterium tuberculosis]COX46875.1 Uncharacterised protein [Mycobacterium tuberculosis]COY33644.1 Uncharacterised protein [Mycobacterium tuberculosis]COY57293.1 Uncharacterised protein [Mycobacterium tuberculosis]